MSISLEHSPIKTMRDWIIGKARNPFNPEAFKHVALIAFLAWVGLGADGLSSSCYGPEESFLALGNHTHLALFIAIATAITVFIISLGYNQVVALFPSGGGGYKVATQLLGAHAGLVSGAALIVDYVLTIAISIASGVDALFSFLPPALLKHKLLVEIILVILLTILNLRGVKESIKLLLPIFLGFVVSHFILIIYGIAYHANNMPQIIHATIHETHQMTTFLGAATVAAFLLHSYSLGSGTYTGLEAVSNNVNRLAEPRIRTGKVTMLYMALSLSFMAGGIILLYLLWQVAPVPGETLNAVVFHKILGNSEFGHTSLIITLCLEAGILFVAANTGFLAGPVVLANMAVDNWVPNRFRQLSSRLVTQNGIILFGIAAVIVLLATQGEVSILVVLYSINVFLTFTLTLLGLCVYWCKDKNSSMTHRVWRFLFSLLGFFVTSSILIVTVLVKFKEGGWLTVIITSLVIIGCLLVKKHYMNVKTKLAELTPMMAPALQKNIESVEHLHPDEPTAIFFVGTNIGVGMHTLLWTLRLFPDHFKNFIFISIGIVDIESFRGDQELEEMKIHVENSLDYFINFCNEHNLPAKAYSSYGTDPVDELMKLADEASEEFPNAIFFASKIIFEHENWLTRMLHNETSIALQRKLHSQGKQLIILPMKI